jgi:hypothetical protein
MNHEFHSVSPIARSVFAAAAIVVSLTVVSFIDGLARHYSVTGPQLAAVSTSV